MNKIPKLQRRQEGILGIGSMAAIFRGGWRPDDGLSLWRSFSYPVVFREMNRMTRADWKGIRLHFQLG